MEQKSSPNTVWYFALEPLKSRYTEQLGRWMPDALRRYHDRVKEVLGCKYSDIGCDTDIKQGQVLDIVGRSKWCMIQCQLFLDLIDEGEVKSGDVIYLQDFWTPGIEAIFYTLDLLGIQVRTYAMLHAQSVDEYDFTYKLRGWMRHMELGIDAHLDGIFVASTIHREQLRAAGFKAPIHVVGLPIDEADICKTVAGRALAKKNRVVFTSRLDREKNPFFMLRVAKMFLEDHPDWEWWVTTSRDSLTSNEMGVVHAIGQMGRTLPNFIVRTGLSKTEYYEILYESKIQFNCSLQDYLSWTFVEARIAGCDAVYPDFRSFPEVIPPECRYRAFLAEDANRVLGVAARNTYLEFASMTCCELGRHAAAKIAVHGIDSEINVWHEKERIEQFV